MRIAREVSAHASVQTGEKQQGMIVSRLKRRIQALGLRSEEEYVAYYNENQEEEYKYLLSLLTTHHTFFFREYEQFEYLRDVVLLKLIPAVRARSDRKMRVWSAACSRGQEVYSLAIFLKTVLKESAPDIDFEIVGSDVDSISIDFAKNGVFLKKELDEIPLELRSGHFLRGSDGLENFVKVHPQIKSVCTFGTANLNNPKTWPEGKFDLIFCRNVFIYFAGQDIAQTIEAMRSRLSPMGTVFLGLTEGINGVSTALVPVGPSVYGKAEEWLDQAVQSA